MRLFIKKCLPCLFFVLFSALSLQGIPTKFFSGFDQLLTEKYSYLHPLYGQFHIAKGDIVENFFACGEKNHPLTKICTQLFFRRSEDGTFGATANYTFAATYLDPYEIGWIISLVIFKPEIFANAEMYTDCGKEQTKGKRPDADVCQFLKAFKEKQTRIIEANKKQTKPSNPSVVFKFINTFVDARKRAITDFFSPDIPLHLLLDLACLKSTKKEDLLTIYRGIYDHITDDQRKELFTERGLKILQKSSPEYENFLTETYEKKSLFAALEKQGENANQIDLLAYFIMILGEEKINMLLIKGSSDCTESGLVELVRFLLSNNEGTLTTENLPAEIRNSDIVKEFIKNFQGRSFNDQDARTWFFDRLSKQNDIVYTKTDHEIRAIPENILKALAIIFRIDAKTWEALGTKLSTKDRNVTFTTEKREEIMGVKKEKGIITAITLTITKTDNKESAATKIEVMPGHTEIIQLTSQNNSSDLKELLTKLSKEKISRYPWCATEQDLATLCSKLKNKEYKGSNESLIDMLFTHQLKTSSFELFCFLAVDEKLKKIVEGFFDSSKIIPAAESCIRYADTIVFQNYLTRTPYSTYTYHYPNKIWREIFRQNDYAKQAIEFLNFLSEKKVLEQNVGTLIEVLMEKYDARTTFTRFKNGALEKTMLTLAIQFPALTSAQAHTKIWEKQNLDTIQCQLDFEKWLSTEKKDFFSTTQSMFEFILLKELPATPTIDSARALIYTIGESILDKNFAVIPNLTDLSKQEVIIKNIAYLLNNPTLKEKMVEAFANPINLSGPATRDTYRYAIYLVLLDEKIRKTELNTTVPHALYFFPRYIHLQDFSALKALKALIETYHLDLWNIIVKDTMTFAELCGTKLSSYEINKLPSFPNVVLERIKAKKNEEEEKRRREDEETERIKRAPILEEQLRLFAQSLNTVVQHH